MTFPQWCRTVAVFSVSNTVTEKVVGRIAPVVLAKGDRRSRMYWCSRAQEWNLAGLLFETTGSKLLFDSKSMF